MRSSKVVAFYLLGNFICLALVGYGHVRLKKVLNLNGDTTQVLNFAKSAIDGLGFRYNPSLGYPGIQDNAYWPTFDFSGRLLLWLFGRFTSSPELSYHLLYVTGVCLMASGMLFGLLSLAIRPWLALVGTCAFIATPFFASRIIGHDFLSLYYGAAFGGTLSVLVASQNRDMTIKALFQRPSIWLLIWFSATSGLYYCFFTCMFTCVGGLMNAVWQRRLAPLAAALSLLAVIVPLLAITGYNTSLVDVLEGRIPQVTRGAFEQLLVGLNPAEAVASLAVLPGLGWTLNNYEAVLPLIAGIKGLYEWPSALICIFIFSAPVIVALLSREQPLGRSRYKLQLMQIAALFITFGMLYAVRGGLAFYFNIFVSGNIRATDRIMPFLTFFAIVGLCAGIETALDLRRKWVGWSLATVAVAGLLYGTWPIVGALARKQQLVLSSKSLMDSLTSTRQMLLAKNTTTIAAVLQLPHVAWPEQSFVGTFDPYAHQNAYILDRAGSTTRWSYGSSLLQPAYQVVQRLVTEHTTSGLDPAARDLGFDAILIEKAAFSVEELARLRANVERDLGGGCRIFDDDFRVLYALNAQSRGCLE